MLPTKRGLPPYSNTAPEKLKSWRPIKEPSKEEKILIAEVKRLKDNGLTGMQIQRTWLERQVQSFTQRAHPMHQYKGQGNITRLLHDKMPKDELLSHMHFVTHVPIKDISLSVAIEPFHYGKPPVNVSTPSDFKFLFLAYAAHSSLRVFQDFGTLSSMPPLPGQALSAEMKHLMELQPVRTHNNPPAEEEEEVDDEDDSVDGAESQAKREDESASEEVVYTTESRPLKRGRSTKVPGLAGQVEAADDAAPKKQCGETAAGVGPSVPVPKVRNSTATPSSSMFILPTKRRVPKQMRTGKSCILLKLVQC